GSVDSTVSLAASGFLISTLSTMNISPPDANISVSTVSLDGSNNPVEAQAVASGVSISVTVASDNSLIGNVTASPITIGSGSGSASTAFHAVGLGTAHVTASALGYGPGSAAITVVAAGHVVVSDGLTIGQFLQENGQLFLPAPAPAGGVH